jgi:predicted  nucleic acid-binding Zn-ribbon protein
MKLKIRFLYIIPFIITISLIINAAHLETGNKSPEAIRRQIIEGLGEEDPIEALIKLTSNIANEQEARASCEHNLAASKLEASKCTSDLEERQKNLTTTEAKLEENEKALKECLAREKRNKHDLEEQAIIIKGHKTEIADLKVERDRAIAESKKHETQRIQGIEREQAKSSGLKDEIKKLEAKLKKVQEENVVLSNALRRDQEKLFASENRVKYLEDEVAKLKEGGAQAQVPGAEKSQPTPPALKSSERELKQLRDENAHLQRELQDYKDINETLEKQIAKLKPKKESPQRVSLEEEMAEKPAPAVEEAKPALEIERLKEQQQANSRALVAAKAEMQQLIDELQKTKELLSLKT